MSRGYSRTSGKRNGCRGRAPVFQVRPPRLSIVEPVPRGRLTAGVVVWAHVPYRDGTGEKTRPAVVLSATSHEVMVLAVTTSSKRLSYPWRYVELLDRERAGILRPSAVDLEPISIDRIDVVNITGELSTADAERVLGPFTETGTAQVERYADAV